MEYAIGFWRWFGAGFDLIRSVSVCAISSIEKQPQSSSDVLPYEFVCIYRQRGWIRTDLVRKLYVHNRQDCGGRTGREGEGGSRRLRESNTVAAQRT